MMNIESENIGLSELPEFKINKKSAYDIFRKANEIETKVKILKKEENINLLGFCSVKCLLDNREDCYTIIYLFHKFGQILGSFNDYIGGSQGNEYVLKIWIMSIIMALHHHGKIIKIYKID